MRSPLEKWTHTQTQARLISSGILCSRFLNAKKTFQCVSKQKNSFLERICFRTVIFNPLHNLCIHIDDSLSYFEWTQTHTQQVYYVLLYFPNRDLVCMLLHLLQNSFANLLFFSQGTGWWIYHVHFPLLIDGETVLFLFWGKNW